jgi:SET domain-containing protein
VKSSNDGLIVSPTRVALLTPAWYLNHSKKPNMAADENYDFYSLRRIKNGEELTVDYDTYADT